MKMRRGAVLGALALSVVGMIAAYRVGRARADGVPMVNPLYYGGMLDDGGRPLEGTRNVTVRLWDAATAGATVCTTTAGATAFSAGRFRVALDSSCVGAVRANPELWAELQVDTTTFPRSKLGAVPYALEAGRASGAAGPLERRIVAAESLAQPKQVQIGTWMFDEFSTTAFYGGGYGAVPGGCSASAFQTLSNPIALTLTATSTALYRISTTAGISPSWPGPSTSPANLRIDSLSETTPVLRGAALAPVTTGGSTVAVSAIYRLTAGATYTFVLQARGGCNTTSGTSMQALAIHSPIMAEQLN